MKEVFPINSKAVLQLIVAAYHFEFLRRSALGDQPFPFVAFAKNMAFDPSNN